VWYPTQDAGPVTPAFDSKVWVGNPVVMDGAPAAGAFPLVVVSHGMFGNAFNQAWFAAAMAEQGHVVAAISHPGTSTWARDPDDRRELWERPRDVSRVIDVALAAGLPVSVDAERVYMAGHSLGAFTGLALAGGRYDAARFDAFCEASPGEMVCDILKGWQIAQTPEDRVAMEADLADPRIKAFALFDLGGTQSFSEASLAQVDRPMLVFGAPITNSGLDLDIESRALVKALPPEEVRYLEPETLSHFDFLGQCKDGGYELLAREEPGDERICAGGGAERAAKHRMVIGEVLAFFGQS
ncbi:MAG: alpha/beta fold hydrolase, partial [Pseudomonadota bacterium]